MTYANDIAIRSDLTERFFGFVARTAAEARTRHARRRVYRTTYKELSQLSTRQLADLGLTRSGLRRVAWDAAVQTVR